MPANRKPKAWNLKPQLTAAPELWIYAKNVFPFWEGVGGATDLVTLERTLNIEKNSAGVFAWHTGNMKGVRLLSNGSTDSIRMVSSPYTANKVYTKIVVFDSTDRSSAVSDFSSRLLAQEGVLGDNNGLVLTTDGRLFEFTSGANTLGVAGAPVLDDGEIHSAAQMFDQVNGRMVQVVDGDLKYDVAYSDNSADPDGKFGLSATQSTDMAVYFAALLESNEAFPIDVLQSITRDPFAMIRPAGF